MHIFFLLAFALFAFDFGIAVRCVPLIDTCPPQAIYVLLRLGLVLDSTLAHSTPARLEFTTFLRILNEIAQISDSAGLLPVNYVICHNSRPQTLHHQTKHFDRAARFLADSNWQSAACVTVKAPCECNSRLIRCKNKLNAINSPLSDFIVATQNHLARLKWL